LRGIGSYSFEQASILRLRQIPNGLLGRHGILMSDQLEEGMPLVMIDNARLDTAELAEKVL
jgi:hypothetical protein